MTNIILSILLLTNGVTQVTIPPTDPAHVFRMETTTNLNGAWDNTDAISMSGNSSNQFYFQSPPRQQEFFRLTDLGTYVQQLTAQGAGDTFFNGTYTWQNQNQFNHDGGFGFGSAVIIRSNPSSPWTMVKFGNSLVYYQGSVAATPDIADWTVMAGDAPTPAIQNSL